MADYIENLHDTTQHWPLLTGYVTTIEYETINASQLKRS